MSGSFVLLRGVGTQMMMASAFSSTSGSVEAESFFPRTSGSSKEVGTSSMYDFPALMESTLPAILSKATVT